MKKLVEILPDQLYVCSNLARSRPEFITRLKEQQFALILDLAPPVADEIEEELGTRRYRYVPISDGKLTPERLEFAYRLSTKVGELLEKGGKALLSCNQGRNRSCLIASLVVSYIQAISTADALEYVREKRPLAVGSNQHFERYLLTGEHHDS